MHTYCVSYRMHTYYDLYIIAYILPVGVACSHAGEGSADVLQGAL